MQKSSGITWDKAFYFLAPLDTERARLVNPIHAVVENAPGLHFAVKERPVSADKTE
jgi:hypothetical protein